MAESKVNLSNSDNTDNLGISGVKLYSRELVYVQEPDTWDDTGMDQELRVTTLDGGGGSYITIETKRWAIDRTDIDGFCKLLRSALEGLE